jgi:two-component system, sensor histidine kinase and response regulator
MSTYSILIVDDQPDNFDVIQVLLPSETYNAHYASNGQSAIAALDKIEPDVILLDVMMPEISGIEICKQIKAMSKWQSVPIVMVTSLARKEDLAMCLAAGADDFISKPVSSFELRARVNSMVRIKKQHDRLESLSKLQQNNIKSLTNNLEEIRLDLGSIFVDRLQLPLNLISENNEYLMANIKDINASTARQILEQSNRNVNNLRQLVQKLRFYLQKNLLQKPEPNNYILSTKITVEKNLLSNLHKFAQPIDINCEIEDTRLAVSQEHFQLILDEVLDFISQKTQPFTFLSIRSYKIENTCNIMFYNRQKGDDDRADLPVLEIDNYFPLDSRNDNIEKLEIGLKLVKKIIEMYNGVFLISSFDAEETTVYLTLPLAVDSLTGSPSQNLSYNIRI